MDHFPTNWGRPVSIFAIGAMDSADHVYLSAINPSTYTTLTPYTTDRTTGQKMPLQRVFNVRGERREDVAKLQSRLRASQATNSHWHIRPRH